MSKSYVDLSGQAIDLTSLDVEERKLLAWLKRMARRADTAKYRNSSLERIADFYSERGIARRGMIRLPLFRVAQDLCSRQMIERGEARAPDYRDQIEELIQSRFPTRRAFCQATGLSEDMLSHVLSKRKHLSVERLNDALERIGYGIRIAPMKHSG